MIAEEYRDHIFIEQNIPELKKAIDKNITGLNDPWLKYLEEMIQ